ncbi:MAG TPA: hypothetical protein VML96_01250 [Egibacteraceae bacterium]|nr:hypothetical protein [Egibacteraceae bacterium]
MADLAAQASAGGIVGVAVVPSAPLLVAATAGSAPPQAADVRSRALQALASLPAADVLVLLAGDRAGAVRDGPLRADLAAIGLPGIELEAKGYEGAGLMADALGYALEGPGRLPLDLAVLTLLAASASGATRAGGFDDADRARPRSPAHLAVDGLTPLAVDGARAATDAPSRSSPPPTQAERLPPVAAICVPRERAFDELSANGATLAAWLAAEGLRAAVVAAGDLSAALRPSAPVFLAEGSRPWDEQALAAIRGDLGALRALGPAEALRVGARGWPALAALHGMLAAAGRRLRAPWYSAHCGVGYAVACDAEGPPEGRHPQSDRAPRDD